MQLSPISEEEGWSTLVFTPGISLNELKLTIALALISLSVYKINNWMCVGTYHITPISRSWTKFNLPPNSDSMNE